MPTLNVQKQKAKQSQFANKILNWYDANARAMPWRIAPDKSIKGVKQDPYFTWMSEVMLQQTQVATVKEYFIKFTSKWPKVQNLANADTEDVMKAWAGLGYYSRARNLKKCAEIIASQHDGLFPSSYEDLKKLPGIGDYTASAIASIAFGKAVPVVDGNVERVITRIERIATPIPEAKSQVRDVTQSLLDTTRAGDFAQAMMDLGATLCTPKKPKCEICPVSNLCQAFAKGDMEKYPVKLPKKQKPRRKGAAFVITNSNGALYLQKRITSGLLGGMSEVPTTDWNSNEDGQIGVEAAPFEADWQSCEAIKHTFTHFHLELEVWRTSSEKMPKNNAGGWWSKPNQIASEALPTVFTKVIKSALK